MSGTVWYEINDLLNTIETYFKEGGNGKRPEKTEPQACTIDHTAVPEMY